MSTTILVFPIYFDLNHIVVSSQREGL